MRTVAAFLAAPLPIAVLGPLLAKQYSSHEDSLTFLLIQGGVTYIYGLVFALMIGAPLFAVLRRRGWSNAYTAIGAGLLIGLLGGVIMFGGSIGAKRLATLAEIATLSAVGGLVFWLVARGNMRSSPSLERP